MKVQVSNRGWVLLGDGNIIVQNPGAKQVFVQLADSQPAADDYGDGAFVCTPHGDPVDFQIAGKWWGRCDNMRVQSMRPTDVIVQVYTKA